MDAAEEAINGSEGVEEEVLEELNLFTQVEPGQVVEIETKSGSTYWIVKLQDATLTNGGFNTTGLSITPKSKTKFAIKVDPRIMQGQTIIKVGSLWHFGPSNHTSAVKAIRL